MIENDQQRVITLNWVDEFYKALDRLVNSGPEEGVSIDIWISQQDSLRYMAEELEKLVEEYDKRNSG